MSFLNLTRSNAKTLQLGCIAQALPSTNCTLTDMDCLCASATLWAQVEKCALATCSVKDALSETAILFSSSFIHAYPRIASRRVAGAICNEPVRDRTKILFLVAPILCGACLVLLILRLLTRLSKLNGALGWDDAVIVAAFVVAAPIAPLAMLLTRKGLGRDIWLVPFTDIDQMLRIFYICQIIYVAAMNLAKIALLLFFLRVFPQQQFRRVCYGMIAFVVAYTIAMIFPVAFQCRPISYTWNQWDGEHKGSCNNIYIGTWVAAATNMIIDLVILVLPLPMLRKLHVSNVWKKIQIFSFFSFGLIITIVSALRLRALVIYGRSNNFTWEFADAGMWSAIEVYTAIMCACLPAARAFFTRTAPKWLGISYATTSRSGAKTPSSNHDVIRNRGRPPKLPNVAHATTMAMSFQNRSTFTELDDYGIELPIQGRREKGYGVRTEVEEGRSWNSLERAESGNSPPVSTKQWS